MKMKYILSFVLGAFTLVSQGQNIRLHSSEDGLPNSKINQVYQDDRGFIWIGTENGAAYFDGMRFTTFHHDSARPGSLSNDQVTVIYNDSRGNCWIGTADGLQVFDYQFNTFHPMPLADSSAFGNYYVSSIQEIPGEDRIIVSVAARRPRVFSTLDLQRDRDMEEGLDSFLGSQYTGKMHIDPDGYLWAYTEHKFSRIDLREKTITENLWGERRDSLPLGVEASVFREDPYSGHFLIGTYNHGLFVYDRRLGYIRQAAGASSGQYRIRDILVEKEGARIWIGTEGDGIKEFDRETETILPAEIQHSPVDLRYAKVRNLMEDSQGNIWVGLYQKGLLVIPRSSYGFEYQSFSAGADPQEENMACVTSVVRDPAGDLWVGTDGGGLFRVTPQGRVLRYDETNSPLHNNSVTTLTLDKSGTLWISTYMGGLTTYSAARGFERYSSHGMVQKVSASVYDAAENTIYFGTHGPGIIGLSLDDHRFRRFPNEQTVGHINALFIDPSRRLWAGSIGGLRCYELATGETLENVARAEIGSGQVYSVMQGKGDILWVGSGNGLVRYDMPTEGFLRYTVEEGLPSNLIYAVQEDSQGLLWIATGNGLSCLDPRTNAIRNFYSYDGLQESEFRNGASFKDADGKMFFGGINGLSAFYPERVQAWSQPISNINFSRLTVLNQTVDYDESLGKHNIIDRHISQARQITLRNDQNVFSLEFSVLEYTNPQKVVYGFRMEGFDPDWFYTRPGYQTATYTNLPAGRYLFRVKAFFDGDPDPENVVFNDIHIRILPPWYRTWWAYLIYAALLAGAVVVFLNYLKRRRLRLQEKVELEKKEMKLRMFTDMSHEIRTPLTLVMTPLKSLRENETDSKRRDIYNLMYRNVLRILRLINQLMDMRKIDNDQLKMHFNRTDMIFFVRDIMKSFDQMAFMSNIDFEIVSNREALEVWIDQGNFDKVLFNIFSNAFKYTPDHGYVLVSLETYMNHRQSGLSADVSRYLELRIENSGSSIDREHLDRIFDRFYQVGVGRAGGSGIGLHLARRIVELHHGTLTAENIENGVVFIVRVPLGNAHLSPEEKELTAKHKDLYYMVRPTGEAPPESEYIELPEFEEPEKVSRHGAFKPTVFFVDDDPDLVKYLRLELSDEYHVETFLNGEDAWKRISAKVPDAVVTDLVMPETDGLALCRKIRENRKSNHIPVIILTAETGEESERRCVECGADSYLTKPVSLELLKGTIAQALRARETIRSKYQIPVKIDYDEMQLSSPDNRFVARVIENIRKNIENPDYSVDDLSRQIGISRVHLNRKLKENINISPRNLIRSIRLRQSAYLLIKHKTQVAEVAYKMGFSTPAYFSSSFKEYFGMPPKEFVARYMDTDDKEELDKLFRGG